MSETKSIRVQYSRPVNGTYSMKVNDRRIPEASVVKQDGGFTLTWHGAKSWHRTMRACATFMGAAFQAKAVPMPAPSRREAGDADLAALAAASKRARTAG